MPLRRRLRRLLIAAGLPGVTACDVTPRRIEIGRPLSRICIWQNEEVRLDLQYVNVVGAALSACAVSMSSQINPRTSAKDVLKGRPVKSRQEQGAWLQIDLTPPSTVAAIEIQSRKGMHSWRCDGLSVRAEDINGAVSIHDFLDTDTVASQAEKLSTAVGQLVDQLSRAGSPDAVTARIATLCSDLIRATIQAVDADDGSVLIQLDASRLELIEEIVGTAETLTDDQLRNSIVSVSVCLEFLISRRRRASATHLPHQETAAAALILASRLYRLPEPERVLSNRFLSAFRPAFSSIEQIEYVESAVTELVRRLDPKSLSPPYVVKVHGISAFSLKDREMEFLSVLEQTEDALTQLGYGSCICYGTLLGAVREKDFIAHDDDVDMGIVLQTSDIDSELESVLASLKSVGFRTQSYYPRKFARVSPPASTEWTDLFAIAPGPDGTVQMLMEGMKLRQVPASLVLPLSKIEFRGRTFSAPNDPQGFLENRYGANWRTPLRKLGHRMVPPHVAIGDGFGGVSDGVRIMDEADRDL